MSFVVADKNSMLFVIQPYQQSDSGLVYTAPYLSSQNKSKGNTPIVSDNSLFCQCLGSAMKNFWDEASFEDRLDDWWKNRNN